MIKKDIFVTRPHLPDLEEFLPYLQEIWSSGTLTNGGPFHQKFERALCDYLGLEHVALVSNGTLGLIIALQAMRAAGEVITTPYSFVATSHSILWTGGKPVFVDIDPKTLNIDPGKIESAITPQTTAIMPVHCYGNPCDVEAIQKIADNYNLRVIYDAAHAFGVQDAGGSILRYGDLSVLSFHATKVFHTFEGGAIVCPDTKTKQHIDHLKNFGYVDETTVVAPGINSKMSEINAAFGLVQLEHIDGVLLRRKEIDQTYRVAFKDIKGISCLYGDSLVFGNHSYFPILVDESYPLSRNALYERLKTKNIFARRYFFPLISDFPMYRGMHSASRENLPIANRVASQVLCLPIYPSLSEADQQRIIHVIREARS